MGLIRAICDGDYEKRDRVRKNFTLEQLIKLYEKPITPLMPIGVPAAASMAAPIMRPEPERVTINLGDNTKVSISMDEIQERIQRDLFRAAMIPSHMFEGRRS